MLHPFLCSQQVWSTVAPQLAATGRFEVFAPTMPGHHGGPPAGTWLLSAQLLADHVERQMDELGWPTAHLVGNSLGGWVAFELERRGRARTVTGIAPAGGWTRWSSVKFETIAKFISGGPVLAAARILGPRILDLPFARRMATLPVSGPADGPTHQDLVTLLEDATHCPAYFALMVRATLRPGLPALTEIDVPTHLVLCTRDRVFPAKRGHRYFVEHLPASARVTRLQGLGHIPMLEAPDRITALVADFIDEHTGTQQAERLA